MLAPVQVWKNEIKKKGNWEQKERSAKMKIKRKNGRKEKKKGMKERNNYVCDVILENKAYGEKKRTGSDRARIWAWHIWASAENTFLAFCTI